MKKTFWLLVLLSVVTLFSCLKAIAQDSCSIDSQQIPTNIFKTDAATSCLSTDSIEEISVINISSHVDSIPVVKNACVNIYDRPYSSTFSCPNKRGLVQNAIALYGCGLLTLGFLELLPESAVSWDKKELRRTPFFERWWNHVREGVVLDEDHWYFNYLIHPYVGSIYYMSARSQGLNSWQSMLYAFGVSTILWEYGIEAFMESPSIQDLLVTPIAGSIIGELFYCLKRRIVNDDYRLFGSKVLGNIVAFLIDPVNEFLGIFRGNPCRTQKKRLEVSSILSPNAFKMSITF